VDLGNADACRYVSGHHPCLFGEPTEAIAYVLCVPLECTEQSYASQGLPVRCGVETYEADAGTAFVIVVYVLLGLLAVIGAVLGSFPRLMEVCTSDGRRESETDQGAFTQLAAGAGDEFRFRGSSMDELLPAQDSQQRRDRPRGWERRFLCFDLFANTRRLLAPRKSGAGSLAAISGLRVISALWILLFHTYFAVINGPGENNYADVHPVGETKENSWIARWSYAAVTQGHLGAEAFFVLAGFLAVRRLYPDYARSREDHISIRPLNIFFILVDTLRYVVTRLVRLTPALFIVALSAAYFVPTIGRGLWWDDGNRGNCRSYWHLDVLYVSNIDWRSESAVDLEYTREDQCLEHAWFLAALVQYALLTPVLVWLYVLISRRTSKALAADLRLRHGHQISYVAGVLPTGALMLASIFRSYANSYLEEWSPFFFTESSDFYWEYYLGPASRVPSYCIGLLFAFFWEEWTAERTVPAAGDGAQQSPSSRPAGLRRFQRHLSRSTLALLFATAAFLILSTLYAVVEPSQHESRSPPFAYKNEVNALYVAFGRPAFALGVAIVCFILFNRQGGVVQTVLGSHFMTVGGRLAYSFFLVSVPVLDWYLLQLQTRVHWNLSALILVYFGAILTSLVLAVLLYLFVELPFCQMYGTCAVDDPDEGARARKLAGLDSRDVSFSGALSEEIYGSQGIEEILEGSSSDAELDASRNDIDRTPLQLNEHVYVRSRGGTRFYRATIESINMDGSYDVVYDDGKPRITLADYQAPRTHGVAFRRPASPGDRAGVHQAALLG